jgi:hypothetical protein
MKRLTFAVLILSGAVSTTLGQSEEKKALPPSLEAEHRSKMWQVLENRMRQLRGIDPVDASQVSNLEKLYIEAKDRNWNYGELERLLAAVESFMAKHTNAKAAQTPSIKAEYLEKTFALKMTKSKVVAAGDLVVTFEFVEDVKDMTKLLEAIRPMPEQPTKPMEDPKQANEAKRPGIVVYGFDGENVPVMEKTISAVTTVTGIKGDAFRVTVKGINKSPDGDVAKVEFRPRVRPQAATQPAIPKLPSAPLPKAGTLPPINTPPIPSPQNISPPPIIIIDSSLPAPFNTPIGETR